VETSGYKLRFELSGSVSRRLDFQFTQFRDGASSCWSRCGDIVASARLPALAPWPECRFYEAEFVKTRCENCLCLIFCSFLPMSDNNSPLWLWCLIIAAGGLRRNDQTPKSVTASSAQRSWFKANNGINGRGPPQAGRMPFMPAVSLNQWSGALPKRGVLFSS
jgi:hypothetical protein